MLKKVKLFLFHNSTIRQTFAKNTLWLSISQIGGRLLRAVVIIYAARVLGAEGWGVFSYAMSIVAFLAIFTDIGINPVLTREVAKASDDESRTRILSTSFFMKSIMVVLSVFIVISIAPKFVTLPGVAVILPFAALILAFDALREFGFSLSRALEKMEVEAGLFLLTNAAIVAFGLAFLLRSPTVSFLMYGYTLGVAIGAIVTFITFRKYFKRVFRYFTRGLVKPLISSAWPFAVSGLLGVLLINTDILIIGFLGSAEEVGLYSAAERIVRILYVFPAIISVSILPTLARLAHADGSRMGRVLTQVVKMSFFVAIPVALGGFIVGQKFIPFIFGNSYMLAVVPFQILVLTLIIDFPSMTLKHAIFAKDQQKKLIAYAALVGGLNVVLDILFIPKFGIVGSAWATFISQIVSALYLWYTLKKIMHDCVVPDLRKIVLAAGVMSVFVWAALLLQIHVLIAIALAIFVYFAVLYVLKEQLLREVKMLYRQVAGQ